MKELKGIFCPVTTPFDRDGGVDFGALGRNAAAYAEAPVQGHLILGSNGENKSLLFDEKLRVIETVMNHKGKDQVAMVGSIFESTRETVAFAKKAEQMGADYITLLPPSYFKKDMTDAALIRYFTDVADALSVPCLLYNAPQFSGTLSLGANVLRTCAAHPNIAGLKDSSDGVKKSLLAVEDIPGFVVLSGSINTFAEALSMGAAGGVLSLANSSPRAVAALFRMMSRGEYSDAFALSKKLIKLNLSISGKYSLAGVKYAMDLNGFAGGDPRLPLLPLGEAAKEEIRAAVEAIRALTAEMPPA